MWSILENNMKDAYTRSSFGWKPDEKRAELFHDLSRFILLVSIGKRWKMQNKQAARNLYRTVGFEIDPTSPEYPDSDEEDSQWSGEEVRRKSQRRITSSLRSESDI
ncbi:uncharacterized protein B0H18DRAFT_969194 [Fomitopsis serialis]|uniref:uncharacterized protein n=1 Tax=Fomitopsis serialis TaxID=139415 RepID=UPI0020081DE1|nr:uncharacterized protein B0H18DRAFT_969194 [Neoantrodia serialis]KAH9937117.1 hypothetical protein B0H18DRAFT_969194 [Neoantrodia serialis]